MTAAGKPDQIIDGVQSLLTEADEQSDRSNQPFCIALHNVVAQHLKANAL